MTTKAGRGREARERKRRTILDAARAEIAQHGIDAVRMRDVAVRAGVSPGTLYTHFDTREAILLALHAERIEELSAEVTLICLEATDLEALLAAVAAAFLPVYAEYGVWFDHWAQRELASGAAHEVADQAAAIIAATARVRVTIMTTIGRLGALDDLDEHERELLAALLWAVLIGVSSQFAGPRHLLHAYSFDDLNRFGARLIANALAAGPDALAELAGTADLSRPAARRRR